MDFASGSDLVLFSVKHDVIRPSHGKNQRKDQAMCTHCGYSGHTMAKYYKLYGYPPGYKLRQRTNPNQINSNHINFAITTQVNDNNPNQFKKSDIGDFMQSLNHNQYQ